MISERKQIINLNNIRLRRQLFNYYNIMRFDDSDPIIIKDEKLGFIHQFISVTNLRLFQTRHGFSSYMSRSFLCSII